MAQYVYEMGAQPWRRDPYYVASSQKKELLSLVARNDDEAFVEARNLLRPIDSAWYWKIWVISRTDLRIIAAKEGGSHE